MIECKTCKISKSEEGYYKSSRHTSKRFKECRDCISIKHKVYRAKEKERYKKLFLVNSLKRLYGLSYEDYLSLLERQEFKCAICKKKAGKRRLSVDHNHTTNKVRGLLCDRCNVGLGMFGDSPQLFYNALDYISVKETPST